MFNESQELVTNYPTMDHWYAVNKQEDLGRQAQMLVYPSQAAGRGRHWAKMRTGGNTVRRWGVERPARLGLEGWGSDVLAGNLGSVGALELAGMSLVSPRVSTKPSRELTTPGHLTVYRSPYDQSRISALFFLLGDFGRVVMAVEDSKFQQ